MNFIKKFSKGFISNTSIRNKLLFFFLLIAILPISILSLVVYNLSTDIINNRIQYSLQRDLNTAESNIRQKLEAVNDIATLIYLNPQLLNILSSNPPSEKIDTLTELEALDKIMESYSSSNITQTAFFPVLYMYQRPLYAKYNFSKRVFDFGSIEKYDWYKELEPQRKYSVVGLNKVKTSSGEIDTLMIAKQLYGLKSSQLPFAGILTLDIGVDDFSPILNSLKPSVNSTIYVTDKNMKVVLGSNRILLGKQLFSAYSYSDKVKKNKNSYGYFFDKVDNVDMLISYKKMPQPEWTLISLSPTSELFGQLIKFKQIALFALLACFILAVMIALVLSENISYPIRKLVKSMSSVQNGNLEIQIEYKRKDEFSQLINSYQKMLKEIKELINKLYISEVNKKEAELKALQAQINPHFLYNTLDSVNWLAMTYNVTDISTMVTSLSDFFRYSLSKGKSIIPIRDEIKQVESYLLIQKIRFQNRLDYTIDFPMDILGYLTPKLILQPIVENAIIHGIEKKRGSGTITMIAKKNDNQLEISITDNGLGANPDELNEILYNEGYQGKSFAIRNVHERIRQLFGNDYGIKFFSNINDSGITVLIRIPAVRTLEVAK